jgi:membrane protease YdiL (CAAX protease family)
MILTNPETRPVSDYPLQECNPPQDLFRIGKIHLFLFFNLLLIIACGLIFAEQMVLGSIILEVLILLVTVGWIGLQKMKYQEILKLKVPNLRDIGVTLVIVTCGIYVASFIELLFRYYLQSWGKIVATSLPRPQSNSDFWFSLLAIVILPAFAEEILFRGFILQNYRKILGNGQAVFLSALLFGIAHLNIQNFWGPFILGIICGWLVCLFDSIILACLGHLLNNGLIFAMTCLIPDFGSLKSVSGRDLLIQIPAFVISGLIILILFLRYNEKLPKKQIKPGVFLATFRHWTTWLLLLIFFAFTTVQLVMMKTSAEIFSGK